MKFLFVFLLLLLPTYSFAASNSEIVTQIVAGYSVQCSAEQEDAEDGEVISEIVPITVPSQSLYEIEITEDGKLATILFADFSCPNWGASYWCGSSGCAVYIIVDGVSYRTRGWKPFSVTRGEEVLVILPKSGIACDQYNAAPCFAVTVWDESETTFNSIGSQLRN